MGGALFAGTGDIAEIMLKAGLGILGLLIIVLSTVTTTFLDAYSAGISAESLSNRINGKHFAIIVTIIGTLCASVFPMDDITNFLYLIGSVFAPMIAIMIADFFVLNRNFQTQTISISNIIVWFIGFLLYRWLMTLDLICGSTFPDMILTLAFTIISAKFLNFFTQKNNK